MITLFKIFENVDDYSTWKAGDEVYCLDNDDEHELRIGQKYTISVIGTQLSGSFFIGIVSNNGEKKLLWKASRFTKDPRKIAQKRFDL